LLGWLAALVLTSVARTGGGSFKGVNF